LAGGLYAIWLDGLGFEKRLDFAERHRMGQTLGEEKKR
jgi:hypothetical protein